MRKLSVVFLASLLPLAAACSDAGQADEPSGATSLAPEDEVKPEEGKSDASALATILDFEFDGDLVTDSAWDTRRTIQDQLLYTIGHLNGNKAVGRLDALTLTDIKSSQEGGKTRVTYHAKMPVAWGSKTNLPTSYALTLPRDVSYTGTEAFTAKYKGTCAEYGAHDVDSGSMWYYFRPAQSRCKLEEADVVKLAATVTVSSVNTTGKYAEYHKVWEDGQLKVVAVFGKYEDGATTSADAGVAAYNEFVGAIRNKLSQYGPATTPETVPAQPGVSAPDIEFVAQLPEGRSIQVNALLVDNVANAGTAFYDRYEGLSTRADLIAYNGHAGLGQNVRALAKKGKWVAEQYLILFMNGCDTYAYVDGSLAQTRAAFNPDDPTGTKYMEIVTNAMPAYFASDSEASMAIVNGLLSWNEPRTYEKMFKDIDSHQIVLVTGEQDNVYVPGYEDGGNPPPPADWEGLSESGTVTKGQEVRWETPSLAAGNYSFNMTGTGDADLYVRVGTAPTTTLYDCRPYRAGSKENCSVSISTPAPVHVMVRGWANASTFELKGARQ